MVYQSRSRLWFAVSLALVVAFTGSAASPALAQSSNAEPTSGEEPDSVIDSRRSSWAKKKRQGNEAKEVASDAKSRYPNATRAEPKGKLSPAGQKNINRAYELIGEQKYPQAEAILREVAASKKSTPYERALALQGLSSAAWEQERSAEALDFGKQALATNALPNDAHFTGMYQLAQMNVAEEKYDAALALIDQWLRETRVEKADAHALRGNALYRLERFPEAATSLKRAIEMSDKPNDGWTQMLLGTYYEQENYAEAATVGEAMLAKDPDNEKLIANLASAYSEGEQNEKALALLDGAYKRGVLKSPEQIKQLYQLYNYLEKPKDAARVINEGIAKGTLKEDLETTKALAYAHVTAEEYEPAAAAYGKAAQFAEDGEMDYQRGYLLVQELDKVAEGKAALATAIQRGVSKPGNAWILVGNAELELGNKAAAVAAYEKARGFPESKSMAETWLKGNNK